MFLYHYLYANQKQIQRFGLKFSNQNVSLYIYIDQTFVRIKGIKFMHKTKVLKTKTFCSFEPPKAGLI